MKRDHHPHWVEKTLAELNRLWARQILYPQFESIGADPRFSGPHFVHLQGPQIVVGDNFHCFATRDAPTSLSVNPYDGGEGHIHIGSYCVLSPGVRIRSAVGVDIGDNSMIAEHCYITDADWHGAYHRIYPGKTKAVHIGDNVWLGDSVTITKGVNIGDNAIVGAASVVTKDVPANTIFAGNPAKQVGELDGEAHFSMREHLFTGGRPYGEFKDEYDRERLKGNTLGGWLKAILFPGLDS